MFSGLVNVYIWLPCSLWTLYSFIFSDGCTDGEIRLMGGSTDREGRVEVCLGGQWRTVCTGSQELAGAVCSQMGYIFEGNGVEVIIVVIHVCLFVSHIVMPRCACASEVYGSVFVCVCVRVCLCVCVECVCLCVCVDCYSC